MEKQQGLFDRMKSTDPSDSSNLTRAYYDSILLDMRYIDSVRASTRMSVFGRDFDTPIGITAISHLTKFGYGENGMVKAAQAAKAMNCLNFCGAGSEEELEDIIATGAQTIKIVKPFKDPDRIYQKIRHAEIAGALGVGMDIDHCFRRDGSDSEIDGEALSGKTFAEMKDIIASTKLPFVVKGVLSVHDARKAVDAGAKAIMVSNHHGLTPFMVPPPMALPEIVLAVGGKIPVFIDSMIQSGLDAFKALALGAHSTYVGRPLINLIRDGGMEGARKWLYDANEELRGAMTASGCASIADIDTTHIRRL